MRSGTTTLHETLGSHPAIFMSRVKEPAYFADPIELATDSRIAAAAGYARNRSAYADLFADAGDARYVGESSTHYTKQPRITGIARRMASETPDAKVVYLIRDPVERTLSHYRYSVRAKYERRTAIEALSGEPIYCAVSDYAMQITPFLDAFGPAAVHIVVLEELSADPSTELARIFAFLGLGDAVGSVESLQQRNQVTGEVVRARGPEVLHAVGRSRSYQRLARTLLPAGLRRRVRRSLNEPVSLGEDRTDDVLSFLRETHEPHADATERLLGRTMTRWTTLRPGGT